MYRLLRHSTRHLTRRCSSIYPSLMRRQHCFTTSVQNSELQTLLNAEDKRFIVLDDDPTGCQTVHDVNVLLDFDVDSLCEQLLLDEKCFYILTNSRAMTEPDAIAVTSLVLANIQEACRRTEYRTPISFISRGDSCLRGHYPAEVDTITQHITRNDTATTEPHNVVTILLPAFIEGGRITKDSIHYVKEGDHFIPVGETPFAKDPHFSFHASNLREYVKEKTQGRITDAQIKSVTLSDMRDEDKGIHYIMNILLSCANGDVVVVDLEEQADMEIFVTGLLRCEQTQHKKKKQTFVYRTAASFVASRCGISYKPLLTAADITDTPIANTVASTAPPSPGGLIVVGSYVPKTTAQLSSLCDTMDIQEIEFDVTLFQALREASPALVTAMTDSITQQINRFLKLGKHVVFYTSRREVVSSTAKNKTTKKYDSIDDFTAVSDALTAVVDGLEIAPSFLIAKGGITSHDVAHKGLHVSKARVVGQVATGIPVWKTMAESKFPGMHYIVFPGNVGNVDTLALVAEKLGVARSSPDMMNSKQTPPAASLEPWNESFKQKNQTFQILESARASEKAVAAFNVYNLEGAKAAVTAAEEQGMPILLQVHPSSLEFGGRQLLAMLCAFRDHASVPVGVHLDHSTREEEVKLALECGVDSVMVDGSHLPYEENVLFTKAMVNLAHARGVVVEAELGRLAGEEDGLSVSEKEAKMTDPAVVQHFLRETQVDMLAVTIGNVHGKYKHPPALDLERMAAIRSETIQAAGDTSPCLLVLHGASGLSEEVIRQVVEGGVCKFNVNTDLRSAAICSMRHTFDSTEDNSTIEVLGLMAGSCEAMQAVARQKIDFFRLKKT